MAALLRKPFLLPALVIWLVALPLVATSARPVAWASAASHRGPLPVQESEQNEETPGHDGEDPCGGKCGEQVAVKGLKHRRLRITVHPITTLAWVTRIAETPPVTSLRRPVDDDSLPHLEFVAASLGRRGPPSLSRLTTG